MDETKRKLDKNMKIREIMDSNTIELSIEHWALRLTIIRKDFNFTQAQATFNANQLNGYVLADQRSSARKCFRCTFIWSSKWKGQKETNLNKYKTMKQSDWITLEFYKNQNDVDLCSEYSWRFFCSFRHVIQSEVHTQFMRMLILFRLQAIKSYGAWYLPTVPGYHAHNGLRCKSKLLFPTRISRSWSGGLPQHPRVVIRTTRTVCDAKRSTRHHGDGSFCVSEHFCSSGFSLPNFPSLARPAGPARVDDDWFTGFLYATFVPAKI